MTPPDSTSGQTTILGHLDELRKTILLSLAYLTGGTLVGLVLARQLVTWLKWPVQSNLNTFVLMKPTEVISIYFKVALYCGGILAGPVIIYQVWRFIRPALSETGRGFSLIGWLLAAVFLFLSGTAFAYFVAVPMGFNFLLRLTQDLATPMMNLNSYISFALAILLLGGFMFQIPILAGILTQIGLISPGFLSGKRKEAIFILLVIAAVVTPTTDAFNMLLFALPMILLFEVGIWVSRLTYRPDPNYSITESYSHEGEQKV